MIIWHTHNIFILWNKLWCSFFFGENFNLWHPFLMIWCYDVNWAEFFWLTIFEPSWDWGGIVSTPNVLHLPFNKCGSHVWATCEKYLHGRGRFSSLNALIIACGKRVYTSFMLFFYQTNYPFCFGGFFSNGAWAYNQPCWLINIFPIYANDKVCFLS